jgi:hypothetical protein
MRGHENLTAENYDYTTAYREHGNGIYLASGETFGGVIVRDVEILEREGVTKEEVGQSLRRLFNTYNTYLEMRAPQIQEPIPGVILARQWFPLGYEQSPYIEGLHSSTDWRVYVKDMSNGNKAFHPPDGPTIVSDMLPRMIEELGFFEGQVFYGIQPEWAIAMHRLIDKHQPEPYVPTFTKDAWDYTPRKFSQSGQEFAAIEENQIGTEEIAPGVVAIIAPGDIAPFGGDMYTGEKLSGHKYYGGGTKNNEHTALWAIIEAQEETEVLPELTLHGMPFGMYTTKIWAGRTLAHVFPFTDKQVA